MIRGKSYELEVCFPVLEGSNSGLSGRASDARSTRSSRTSSAGSASRRAGQESPSGETSPSSTSTSCPRATFSSEASPARESASLTPPRELACMILAAASGATWRELSKLNDLSGSWSRTWRTAGESGFPVCDETWEGSATKRFRSSLRHASAASGMSVDASSCWPTPTASSYGSTNNGVPPDGREQYATKGKPSLWSLASREGGKLNPDFSLALMGFPEGWLDLPSALSGMPLFPSAPRLLDT